MLIVLRHKNDGWRIKTSLIGHQHQRNKEGEQRIYVHNMAYNLICKSNLKAKS